MPRVKLIEQDEYKFHYKRKISKSDLNYAGHLGNDSLVTMIQEARVELFKALGFTELNLGDDKTGIIIGDLAVNFKAEGFEGDELLIESKINDLKDISLRLFYRVTRESDEKLIALVETGVLAFDYKIRETAVWPQEFHDKIV